MSKKDALIKEIDEISERVRFWHNIILTLVTGMSGVLFALSQGKVVEYVYVVFCYNVFIDFGFCCEQIGKIEHYKKRVYK